MAERAKHIVFGNDQDRIFFDGAQAVCLWLFLKRSRHTEWFLSCDRISGTTAQSKQETASRTTQIIPVVSVFKFCNIIYLRHKENDFTELAIQNNPIYIVGN